jgi:hypothetical protein
MAKRPTATSDTAGCLHELHKKLIPFGQTAFQHIPELSDSATQRSTKNCEALRQLSVPLRPCTKHASRTLCHRCHLFASSVWQTRLYPVISCKANRSRCPIGRMSDVRQRPMRIHGREDLLLAVLLSARVDAYTLSVVWLLGDSGRVSSLGGHPITSCKTKHTAQVQHLRWADHNAINVRASWRPTAVRC